MRSKVPLFALLFVASLFALPLATHAATIPFFGPIIPQDGTQAVCAAGWGMLITVINNIIAFLITIAIVFVAPLMIAYSGFLFVVNPVNSSGIAEAKKILTNTVVGIVLALASWMIVDALMAVLYNPTAVGRTWSSLISGGGDICVPQAGALPGEGLNQVTGVSAAGGITTGSSGVGVCAPATVGPCAVSNLATSCFGANAAAANAANKVCGTESTGDPTKLSAGDKLADGNSYSVGLFQINLTNSYTIIQVRGQSCADAFTQACQNSTNNNVQSNGACSASVKTGLCGSVSCMQLYNECVASAQNSTNNINQACALSSNGNNWSRWQNTRNACSL